MFFKLIPKNTIKDLLEMKNLLSVKDSYKSLKDKLQTLDYPCIPYIGIITFKMLIII